MLPLINRAILAFILGLSLFGVSTTRADNAGRFEVFEASFQAAGNYNNPYVETSAEAKLTRPDGTRWKIPLFWDGQTTWRFRVSPDQVGTWSFQTTSPDTGLDGQSGTFECQTSERQGSIRPMDDAPLHFQRQDGSPFWFMGDTAWALFTDDIEEQHDRDAAMRYVDARAGQGFNVLHSMLLSEAGWGNRGGLPFTDLAKEQINPGYWQEVDYRLAYANRRGIVCGLALAWGDKRNREPFAWRRFPSPEARQRYARYVAARFSAYDVYFLVSGEWHAEVRSRGSTQSEVEREFIDIGNALHGADPHGRMVAIHPMTRHGSVREFNEAPWMSFGDYQQNYSDLHARILQSRSFDKPVVNSEYGYYLRDRDGDGVPDKDNSTSLRSMRHATWDIVMGGGYVVTGFGTTYFGGNRDPGPFHLEAPQNAAWQQQITATQRLFSHLKWWELAPHDELLQCESPRGRDGEELGRTAPPNVTYWCLAQPGKQYVLYSRGLSVPVILSMSGAPGKWQIRQFDPRSGRFDELDIAPRDGRFAYRPPDDQDWAVVLVVKTN